MLSTEVNFNNMEGAAFYKHGISPEALSTVICLLNWREQSGSMANKVKSRQFCCEYLSIWIMFSVAVYNKKDPRATVSMMIYIS